MARRTENSSFNTVGPKKWYDGWKDMATPGTYERGIFGDLMLPGIACGIKKILLIFNTSLRSPHDPISIVDPKDFNVRPDTEKPIILAYNMFHYESMEPCTNKDIDASVNLVKSYQAGSYQYKRMDLPYMLGIQSKEDDSDLEEFVKSCSKQKISSREDNRTIESRSDLSPLQIKPDLSEESSFITREKKYNHVKQDAFSEDSLSYKLRGSEEEKIFEESDGKFRCPICNLIVKNMRLHFHKNFCINQINIDHFEARFELYQKSKLQRKNKEKKDRWKNNNPELHKERNKMYKKTYKSKDPEEFCRKHLQDVKKKSKKVKGRKSKRL